MPIRGIINKLHQKTNFMHSIPGHKNHPDSRIAPILGFVVLLLLVGIFPHLRGSTSAVPKIVDRGHNVMQQFLWLHYSGVLRDEELSKTLDNGDPFRATSLIFRDFYDGRDVEKTGEMLDTLIKHWNLYETHKLDYTFSYGRLEAGWWSGMDNMMLPMLLVAYHQVQGDGKYLKLANQILDRMLKDPTEGGVLWRDERGCWFSEYSWNGIKPDDEYHVLNGHLLALESLKLVADALGRTDLESVYQCALDGTKTRAKDFLSQGDAWPLYMLKPPTINQVHYLIFETIQFDNLYALTGEIFFREQARLRRGILSERYPIYALGEGDDERIFFSMMGAPHPYALDTYGIRIVCDSPGKKKRIFEQFSQFDENKPLPSRIFIDEKMVLDKNSVCSVSARSVGLESLLYKTSNFKKIKNQEGPRILNYGIEVSLDGFMTDEGSVVIDPARVSSETEEYLNTQARINYQFDKVEISNDSLLGFELTPNRDLAVGVQLSDGSNVVFRYYPKLKANKKNVILLSKLGFDDGQKLEEMTSAIIFVYTHNQEERAVVEIGRVLLFDNQSGLEPYFKNNDVYMYVE